MRFLRVVLVTLCLPLFAVAAPEEAGRKAKEAFTEGMNYFNLGQWEKAVASFELAYKLRPDPTFLYNIGQAYRQWEKPDKALFFYKNYLRNDPKAPNRAE